MKNHPQRRLLAMARVDLAEHTRSVQGDGWTSLHLSSSLPEMGYSLCFVRLLNLSYTDVAKPSVQIQV